MAAEPTKVFIACDIKNGFGAARRRDAIDGARRWCSLSGHSLCQLVGRQTRSATNLDEHSEGLQTNCGQRWTLAGCLRGTGGVCAGSEGGHEGI